jgi:hypothetical protein
MQRYGKALLVYKNKFIIPCILTTGEATPAILKHRHQGKITWDFYEKPDMSFRDRYRAGFLSASQKILTE